MSPIVAIRQTRQLWKSRRWILSRHWTMVDGFFLPFLTYCAGMTHVENFFSLIATFSQFSSIFKCQANERSVYYSLIISIQWYRTDEFKRIKKGSGHSLPAQVIRISVSDRSTVNSCVVEFICPRSNLCELLLSKIQLYELSKAWNNFSGWKFIDFAIWTNFFCTVQFKLIINGAFTARKPRLSNLLVNFVKQLQIYYSNKIKNY